MSDFDCQALHDLPVKYANLESRVSTLERDMEEIRTDLKSFRDETRNGVAGIQAMLQNVTTGALNSMPAWAAQSMKNQSTLIGVLAGVSGSLLAALVAVWTHVG